MTIARLLEPPLFIYPFLLEKYPAGTALFASQVIYWSNWSNKQDASRNFWFYKPMAEWVKDTGLTEAQIRYARNQLKEDGLIEEMLIGRPPVLHYRIGREFRKAIQ